MPSIASTPVVVLDIGSTRCKAALWRGGESLEVICSLEAPPLSGVDPVREGDGEQLWEVANAALETARRAVPAPIQMGLTAQRSSFLVWNASDGKPVSPLFSWQDRQAEAWCARHSHLGSMLEAQTGLRLSPHYFAPKLAWLMEQDAAIQKGLHEGWLRAGTLDSFLLWRWSGGAVFVTDPTMAARTLLMALGEADWSEALLGTFGIPRSALPTIRPSMGVGTRISEEMTLRAAISDQAAGLIGALGEEQGASLVNLGTGGFVLKPTGSAPTQASGYLCGPYCAGPGGMRFALEGTINGIGPALDSFGAIAMPSPRLDEPAVFCLPDTAGVGAPYWRPDLPQTYSAPGASLSAGARRRLFLEGVLFRLLEIVDDLEAGEAGSKIYLAGGMTREPMLATGLASLVEAEVRLLDEREATLLGIARLAAGVSAPGAGASRPVVPDGKLGYLRQRYPEWRSWMAELTARSREGNR